MTTPASPRDCKGCRAGHAVTEELIARLLSVPALQSSDVAVPDDVYLTRLEACASCPSLQRDGFTCGVCGCIVRVMARYRHRACPRPGETRWDRHPPPHCSPPPDPARQETTRQATPGGAP